MPNDNSAHHQGLSAYRQAATLELCDVSKRYPGQPRDALKDLSLSVGAGEVCVLVGPSGSGKTAMPLINRMIPLTSGEILLGGRSVLERGPNELRREIAYVIQQIGLFPHLTVEENIATVRMDEPFGSIDPINRTRLQDEFLRLQKQVRKTVVFVTHDIDEAIKMGDRIAILREGGTLAQYDTPAQILVNLTVEFVARFVGADRALKRLGLATLADIDLLEPEGREGAPAGPTTACRRARRCSTRSPPWSLRAGARSPSSTRTITSKALRPWSSWAGSCGMERCPPRNTPRTRRPTQSSPREPAARRLPRAGEPQLRRE